MQTFFQRFCKKCLHQQKKYNSKNFTFFLTNHLPHSTTSHQLQTNKQTMSTPTSATSSTSSASSLFRHAAPPPLPDALTVAMVNQLLGKPADTAVTANIIVDLHAKLQTTLLPAYGFNKHVADLDLADQTAIMFAAKAIGDGDPKVWLARLNRLNAEVRTMMRVRAVAKEKQDKEFIQYPGMKAFATAAVAAAVAAFKAVAKAEAEEKAKTKAEEMAKAKAEEMAKATIQEPPAKRQKVANAL